jgi:hypothetical protein
MLYTTLHDCSAAASYMGPVPLLKHIQAYTLPYTILLLQETLQLLPHSANKQSNLNTPSGRRLTALSMLSGFTVGSLVDLLDHIQIGYPGGYPKSPSVILYQLFKGEGYCFSDCNIPSLVKTSYPVGYPRK